MTDNIGKENDLDYLVARLEIARDNIDELDSAWLLAVLYCDDLAFPPDYSSRFVLKLTSNLRNIPGNSFQPSLERKLREKKQDTQRILRNLLSAYIVAIQDPDKKNTKTLPENFGLIELHAVINRINQSYSRAR